MSHVNASNSDLVSLCIPTYNGATHLRECLDSAIAQTHANVELLIVDDCSTDETVAIAQSYALRHAKIRIIQNKRNLGLVGNWCRCIELSRGVWIKFLFQDDLIAPSCLSAMLAAATHPIVLCQRHFLFGPGAPKKVEEEYLALPDLVGLFRGATAVGAEQICQMVMTERRNVFGEPTSALLHQSVFENFGLFNADLRQLCDLEYWLRVATNTGITVMPERLATFRYHNASTSATNRDASRDMRISVFDQLIILHEFAHNPHFERLRKYVKRTHMGPPLEEEFEEKLLWVTAASRARATDPVSPDVLWQRDLTTAAARYPHIGNQRASLSSRSRQLLSRHLGWRLGRS